MGPRRLIFDPRESILDLREGILGLRGLGLIGLISGLKEPDFDLSGLWGGGRTDGRTYGRTDRRKEIHPCVLQNIGPSGPLPKKCLLIFPNVSSLLLLITPSRASGTADHVQSLDDLFPS